MSALLWWTIVLGIIFIVGYIALGLAAGRGMGKNTEAYIVANRSLGLFVTLFAVIASWFSGYMFMGLFGASYRTGLGPFIMGYCIFACAVSMILLGVPTWYLGKKYGYISQTDVLSDRYESKNLGLLYGVLWLVLIISFLMANMIGTGALLSGISGGSIPYWVGVVFGGAIMLAYLLIGGTRSMSWVNASQGIILTVVLWASLYILFLGAGGDMVKIVNKIVNTPLEKMLTIPGLIPIWTYGQWFFLGAFGLTWGAFPQLFPSWYAARSPKVIVLITLITALVAPIYFWHAGFGGVMGRVIDPNISGRATDSAFPLLISKLAPPWFSGLFFAGVFAAIISSVAALAIGAAAIVARSIYKSHINPLASQKQEVTASRITLLVVTALGVIFAIYKPPFIMTLGLLFFAGGLNLGPAMWGMYYWPRANKYGVYAGTIVGFGLLVIQVAMGKLQVSWWGMHPGLIGFIPNLIVFVVVSLLTPKPSPAVVDKFHGYLGEKLKIPFSKRPGGE
jgi:SSS family solute:Na+ symporter